MPIIGSRGAPGLYHQTITWAHLLLIHERMQRAGAPETWVSFRAILERYYSPETLGSDLARRIFVLPDVGIDSRMR